RTACSKSPSTAACGLYPLAAAARFEPRRSRRKGPEQRISIRNRPEFSHARASTMSHRISVSAPYSTHLFFPRFKSQERLAENDIVTVSQFLPHDDILPAQLEWV